MTLIRYSTCLVLTCVYCIGTEYVHRLNGLDYNPNEQNSAIEMLLFTARSPGAGDRAATGILIIRMSLFFC